MNITTEDINQMRTCAFNQRPYRTLVQVPLASLMSDDALVTLSQLATTTDDMQVTSHRVVDWKDDADSTLIIEVRGDVTEVVKTIDREQVVSA